MTESASSQCLPTRTGPVGEPDVFWMGDTQSPSMSTAARVTKPGERNARRLAMISCRVIEASGGRSRPTCVSAWPTAEQVIEQHWSHSSNSSTSSESPTPEQTAGLLDAVDLGDVRVVQRGEDAGLPLEARQPVRVGGERRGQHLQRHVAVEPRVAGAVTSPMPPAPSGPVCTLFCSKILLDNFLTAGCRRSGMTATAALRPPQRHAVARVRGR